MSAVARFLVDLAFPRGCAACDVPLRRQATFCAGCAATVEAAAPRAFEDGGVMAALSYGGAVATALHRLKYAGRVDVAPQLAGLLATVVGRTGFDAVIPVPLHPTRLAERGYNQALLIARHLEAGPIRASALTRTRATPQQTRLARVERATNVAGAFSAPRRVVAGARVLLVDDVVTTGATLGACRAALIEAGAASVTAVAVARAE